MKKWLFILTLAALLGSAWWIVVPARAQAVPQISALEIDLWPEYDRPFVLVIYRLTLASQTSLPAEISLRLPLEAGEPNAVAEKQPNDQLFNIQYEIQPAGEWQIVHFTATSPEIQVEYYDSRLVKQGANRSFTYEWPGDYSAEAVIVQVQQPYGASELRVVPGPVSGQASQDGMAYFTKEIGAISAGQSFKIEVGYKKDNESLSVENMRIQPSAPLESETRISNNLTNVLLWIIALVGLTLIFGGGFWYWKSGQNLRKAMPRKRSSDRSQSAAPDEEATDRQPALQPDHRVYCHQCGKRAGEGDRFCRSCGTRLRTKQ